MTITHLRHVDLAVPDYDTQLSFYKDLWGLTETGTDGKLSYLAAEGWFRFFDIADPNTQDVWGTADPMSEIIARDSFNDPDRGLFVAPPV